MSVGGISGSQGITPSDDSAQATEASAAAPAAAAARSTASNVVPLTKHNHDKILADAVKLGDKGIRAKPLAGGLPLGIEFASIDASKQLGAMGSVSFGHKVTILVPQGPLVPSMKVKHDPNKATEFYVQEDASTNTKAGVYGPFKIK
jgi:hypothetical protein